jgi:hypothetical protein
MQPKALPWKAGEVAKRKAAGADQTLELVQQSAITEQQTQGKGYQAV